MKKILKKSLACMLAAILCLTACVGAMATVGAEGAITYAIADVTVNQGEKTVIDVAISNFADVAGLIAEITVPDAVASIDSVKLNDTVELVAIGETAGHYIVDGKTVKFVGLFNSLNEFGDAFANVDALEINIAVTIAADAEGEYPFAAPVFQAGTANEEILDVNGAAGKLIVTVPCKHAETKTEETVNVAATCTTDGSKTVVTKCVACDEVISTEEVAIKATGHAYDDGVETTAPDCENAGVMTFTCANCGHTYTEAIDALGHKAGEATKENEKAADCVNAGSYDMVVRCTVCNAVLSTETKTVDALGHTEVDVDAVAPTCTETGLTAGKKCSVCGEFTVPQVEVPVIDHNYVDGKCDVCGADDPNYKPECEHVDANQDGICDTCDHENLDETLTFHAKSMLLGADIRGILQVRNRKVSTFANTYVSFKVIVEKEGVESELELVATNPATNYTTYGYAITVPAKEMADIINARIVGITADGEAFISNVETWSIKEGLIKIMDTEGTSEARMKLCANMLNYGAEAQKKFAYNLDNLATDGLSEKNAAYIITTTPAMSEIPAIDDSDATVRLKDISFNLAARVQILPRFTVPKADSKDSYKAEVTKVHVAPDGTETKSSFTVEGDKILKSANSTTLAVYIDDLASKELRDVLTVTLYKNGEVVSATHTFSAESALASKFDTNSALITALMNYGDCARAVFG